MPTPIDADGFEDLRAYIVSDDGWRYIGVLDDDGDEIKRFDIVGGPGRWSPAATNPIELGLTVTADDFEADPPITVGGSALYASEGAARSESVHEQQFDGGAVVLDASPLTITHAVELPES